MKRNYLCKKTNITIAPCQSEVLNTIGVDSLRLGCLQFIHVVDCNFT